MKKEADKQRDSVFAEGALSVNEVLRAHSRTVKRILIARGANRTNKNTALTLRLAERFSIPLETCSDSFVSECATGTTHGGVLAEVGERSYCELEDIFADREGFAVMLSGIEDPYNFGYAMRSLYAAGATGFILNGRNWMSAAGVVIRASAGASERCRIALCDDNEKLVNTAHEYGYSVVCAKENSASLYSEDIPLPILLVIGGEKRGIDKNLLRLADKHITVRYAGDFDNSLTAAAASAVIGFEIMRKNIKK